MLSISSRQLKFRLAGFILLMSLVVSAVAYHYYREAKQRIQQEKYNELHAIGQLKSDQITQWIKERFSEANFFTSNVPARHYIERIINGDQEAVPLYRSLLSNLMTDDRYDNVLVLSDQGKLLFSFNPDFRADSMNMDHVHAFLQADRVTLSGFYYCEFHQNIHVEIISPVYDETEAITGAVVFQVDPRDYLYPLIMEWPNQSRTGESYLVRQEGNQVLFLNKLRHLDNSRIDFSLPVTQTDVTAVQAVLGHSGILRGNDYRGEKVIADVRQIPNTSWFIISEIDEKEVFTELNRQTLWILSVVILVILLISSVVVWYYQLRQRNFFQELLEKRSALYQAQEEYGAILYSIGDGVITTDSLGNVRNVNTTAEKLTGWKEGDARGKKIEDVFRLINGETREEMESPVKKVIRDGQRSGLGEHAVLLARNGNEVPILDSGAPIKDSNGRLLGVVLVFSDQSEERLRREMTGIRLRIFEYAYNHSLQETLTRMLDEIGGLFHSPVGFVHFLNSDQKTFWLQAWSSQTLKQFEKSEDFVVHDQLGDSEFWTDVIQHKKTILYNGGSRLLSPESFFAGHPGLTRGIVVPVIRHNRVVALVGIGNKPVDYTENEAEMLTLLADFIREIAEHKMSEVRLQESEEKMRSIFSIAPTGIGVIKNRVITEVNPHLCAMTGYDANELIGRNTQILYPTREEYDFAGRAKQEQISREGRSVLEVRWRKKNGTLIDVLLSSSSVDMSDYANGITFTALDITERNQAKQKMEEHERQLSSMVGNLPGFVYRCKYDKNWTMLYISEKCKEVTGFSAEDFIQNKGLPFNDIIREEYRPVIGRKWEEAIASRNFFEDEYEIVTAEGRMKWVLERGVGVYNDTGDVMFLEGYIEDITERKRTEIELTESENKFRNLFHGHAAAKLIVDPEDGSIADANEAAAEFYGWTVEELKRMNITQINILPPEEVYNILLGAKGVKNARYEFQHRKANGEVVDIENFNSKVIIRGKEYLHAIIHDLTEKKKTERDLFESEERNRLIMDNSMDAILLTKPDGQILSANKAATRMFGMPEEEICRAGRNGIVDTEDSRLLRLLKDRDAHGFVKGELTFVRHDRSRFSAEVTSAQFENSRGELFTSMIIRDITERKRWEDELVMAKEKAEVNDRLKSAFLANMSHEIRTPMNSILGFLGLLDTPDLEEETRHEYLDLVNKSGQRLLSTINDIIEISKIETGAQEVIYSDVHVEETMQFYQKFFSPQAEEKGIELVIPQQVTGEKARIRTDKNKLNSILTNLVNNGIKFTSRGTIQLGNYLEKDMLVFYVKDTGIGIPPEMIDVVFDRFMQADMRMSRIHEGSGLGLAISKAYAEMLGGQLWVESEVGKGSTFYFTIPYLPAHKNAESIIHKPVRPEETLSGKTILVAEDDETSYQFLEAILKRKKVRLIHTTNGKETLEAFREHSDISLVLMDIKMPGIDGYEATREIRKINRDIPVIAQTAYALHGDREMALEAGCNDYIAKPLKADELYAMLRKYMGS